MTAPVPVAPTVSSPTNHPSVAFESAAALARPVNLARDHLLPVLPVFRDLLPAGGLRRGTTVAVDAEGGGATSLALALTAGPSLAGSWVVVVGIPTLGLVAAAAAGLALDRLAIVREPPPDRWATVVAALVDAVDVVMVGPSPGHGRGGRAADVRRLSARVRERGAVLVEVGEPTTTPSSRQSVDLRFTVTATRWEGLGVGHGHLRARRATVEVDGRREASRRRRAELWLPGPDGRAVSIEGVPIEGVAIEGARIVRPPGLAEKRVG